MGQIKAVMELHKVMSNMLSSICKIKHLFLTSLPTIIVPLSTLSQTSMWPSGCALDYDCGNLGSSPSVTAVSWVTWGKSLLFLVTQFPHLQKGDNNPDLLGKEL